MFERIEERIGRAALALARRRIATIAERLSGELPRGVAAEIAADGVRLTGRGLRRRLALQPALRALLARLG